MKERLVRIAKWVAYPLFYLFCLAAFGYLTFPFDRLKDRIIAELDAAQHARGPGAVQRLEIGELDSYWLSGVEVTALKLVLAPGDDAPAGFPKPSEEAKPKESVVLVDEAHARVRILPLLIGNVRVDFGASAFGGEIDGTVPVGPGEVKLELEDVDLGKVDPIVQAVGVPMKGTVSGSLDLEPDDDGKFKKASGSLALTIADASVGDGKTKLKGLLALPEAKLGDVTLAAEAKDGLLKVTKMSAGGRDLELVGDGKVTLREPWADSIVDLYVRFKFADAYRGKNDTTKALLGAPGASLPGMMDLDPRMKKAKRPDGFYGFHIHGPLKRLKFDPTTLEAPSGGKSRSKGIELPQSKKGGGLNLPLGPSTATRDNREDRPQPLIANPPPPPPSPPPAATPEPAPPPPAPTPEPALEAQERVTPPPPPPPPPEEPLPEGRQRGTDRPPAADEPPPDQGPDQPPGEPPPE